MLKKVVSTMLVTGVMAASIVVPAFASAKDRPNPDLPDKSGQVVQSLSSSALASSASVPMTSWTNYSKAGLGYIIFFADQSGSGKHLDRNPDPWFK